MSHAVWDIVAADCAAWLPEQAKFGLQADCVITDAPYHLASIAKRFGGANAAPAKHGRDGAAARLSKGFMGSPTDSGDVSFLPETWRAVATAMKPGARLLAFGGTRTWWKLAAAIDAAGFEVEDTLAWVYGQGLVLRRSRLKPCWEPIVMARMSGPVQNLNVDDCRNERGNWPGNLLHDDSDAVLSCFPDSQGQIARRRTDGVAQKNKVYGALKHPETDNPEPRDDSGSAARFFTACKLSEAEKRLVWCPKATAAERMCHCAVCFEHFRGDRRADHAHGLDDWEHVTGHPTTKPQSLLRHLVRLVCPPGGLALDPFAGSCTTIEAAVAEGRDAIGVEIDASHAESGRARLTSVVSLR